MNLNHLIEVAKRLLPEGWKIRIDVENGKETVLVVSPNKKTILVESVRGIDTDFYSALKLAIETYTRDQFRSKTLCDAVFCAVEDNNQGCMVQEFMLVHKTTPNEYLPKDTGTPPKVFGQNKRKGRYGKRF